MNKINTSNKTANILLLVIDCQNAFINEFTKSYADKISNLVNSKVYKYVAFTKYINTENSIFYKGLKYEKCCPEATLPEKNKRGKYIIETDEDIAKYSVLKGNEQFFASKYKLYLPTEDELRAEIENQKTIFELQQQNKQDLDNN